MKIVTYNVNGVNGRLPVLLRWLQESKPETKTAQSSRKPSRHTAFYRWHGTKCPVAI